MAQDHDETDKKSYADVVGGNDVGEILDEGTMNGHHKTNYVKDIKEDESKSLYSLICLMIGSILFPGDATSTLVQRMRNSVAEYGPLLREATCKTGRKIILWTREGSPLRALLVITVGTIALLTTIALVVFTLFFVAATVNALIISLLISLAVAGGSLALFFSSLTAIYIGALSVASFVISTATISAVVCVLIASGWIGFFYAVWMGMKGILRLAKQSISVMGSAISGNSFSHHQEKDRGVNIESSN